MAEVKLPRGVHCEQCARENPDTSDGYTFCCNEPCCWGDLEKWKVARSNGTGKLETVPGKFVRACCSAVADLAVKLAFPNEPDWTGGAPADGRWGW